MKSRLLSVSVLLLTLLSSACTGGSPEESAPASATDAESEAPAEPEEPTDAEFTAAADAICLDSAQVVAANDAGYTTDSSRSDLIEIEAEDNRLIAERVEQLEELVVPSGLQEQFGEFLELRQESLRLLEERLVAFKKRDKQTITKIDAKREKSVKERNKIAKGMGLMACANQLTSEAEDEIKANIVKFFSKPSAAVCKELATDRLLDFHGSVKKCSEALVSSKKVTVREIGGVEDVNAYATVAPNAYAGKLEVGLLFEEGKYKIASYEATK